MEEEENRDLLAKLLAKRGKLMELKNKITSKGKKEITEEETAGDFIPAIPHSKAQALIISSKPISPIAREIIKKNHENKSPGNSKPATPYSNAQPSISPPPYSPLTPLIITKTNHDNELPGNSKPATPYSNAQPSISPPPYSPLTPLIINRTNHNSELPVLKDKSPSHISSPLDFTSPPCSPSLLMINNEMSHPSSNTSSPLRSMTPETQMLFNTLAEQVFDDNMNDANNSKDEDAGYCCDSDDSVKDPNFNLNYKVTIEDESSTSCSSVDDDGQANINNFISNGELCDDAENISAQTNVESTRHETEIAANDTGRPKRGRKRKHPHDRCKIKHKKYNNEEYTTLKYEYNKKIKPKTFTDYKCKCLKDCASLISIEKRKEEFNKFVCLGSYVAQLIYIGSCVKEEKKKRSYTMTNVPAAKKKPKQFHRVYSIRGVRVCRDMFLKTFQITTQRVTVSLKKLRSDEPLKDGRGFNSGGKNKVSEEDTDFIVNIIAKLPKYESHYRREKNSDVLYLQPGMTLAKIYDIYRQEFIQKYGNERKYTSFNYLKKIFYSKFNLKCKTLKKDTCNTCDKLEVEIRNAKNSEEKEKAEEKKTQHLERATNLRNQMKLDFEQAKNSPLVECLTFDLEKTLPLPRIPTNVAFYKRQLWFYNSGIHSASDDIGHCYVWVEGEAGRGAQEVGSCLKKYINQKLSSTVEHLILWSDCCGGQNRNIKIVLMMKAILNSHLTLKTISFRFLESGHTFLPNDTDFSKIETALKHHQRVYTAEEYIDIIKRSKKVKPLQVYKMEKTDFYSTSKIEKNITNRKKFIDKSKVSWLNAKEIQINNGKMHSIFMRSSLEEDFKEISIEKKKRGESIHISDSDFCMLWPNGKPIAPAKLADLQSMYQYIPEDCLQFYKDIECSEDILDDVDGFGGVPDFDIDGYEDE